MSGTTINVSTSAELMAALEQATGGETIVLATGDYGDLSLRAGVGFDLTYSSSVTIVSEDPDNPASFDTVYLDGVSNLIFEHIKFDYTYSDGDPVWLRPFNVWNSDKISFVDSVFEGDVASGVDAAANGFGYANALSITSSSDIIIEGSEFLIWRNAIILSDSQNVTVKDNEIHSVRSDGLDMVSVSNILIENNHFHDFQTSPLSGDHADMIQMWSTGATTTSSDITIRGNILDMGDGNWTQSIFMRNELVDLGLAGPEMFYQNILIEENVILNGHTHGITVGETEGLVVRNNSVLAVDDPELIPAINISEDSQNVIIEYNVTQAINGSNGQSDWTMANNVLVQNTDLNAPNHYGQVFVESSMQSSLGVSGYVVSEGSAIHVAQAGASQLLAQSHPDGLRAEFDVSTSTDGNGNLIFDVVYLVDKNGVVSTDGVEFLWDFGGGDSVSGQTVAHSFAEAGYFDVNLTVTLPDGTKATTAAVVANAGEDLLSFSEETGLFHVHGYGNASAVTGSDTASTVTSSGEFAIDLGATGTSVEIPKGELERFFGADSFELNFEFKADVAGSFGEIVRLHQSFVVNVTSEGYLSFTFYPAEGGPITVQTTGIVVNDTNEHSVRIELNGATDRLEIYVGETLVASESVTGSVPSMGYWGLAFGNPWNGQNFDATLTAFDLSVKNNEYHFFDGLVDEVVSSTPEVGMDVDPGWVAPPPDSGSPPEPISDQDSQGDSNITINPGIKADEGLLQLPLNNGRPEDAVQSTSVIAAPVPQYATPDDGRPSGSVALDPGQMVTPSNQNTAPDDGRPTQNTVASFDMIMSAGFHSETSNKQETNTGGIYNLITFMIDDIVQPGADQFQFLAKSGPAEEEISPDFELMSLSDSGVGTSTAAVLPGDFGQQAFSAGEIQQISETPYTEGSSLGDSIL